MLRGQRQGLEASRPRPRTSKCVFEDVLEAKDVLEDTTFVYYTCFKTGSYFQLKSFTPFLLLLNVVYKFSCSRDANVSYFGVTTLHLGIRIQEDLHHKTTKSAIRDHFETCQYCKLNNTDLKGFKVLRICNSEYATKIQEALLIKKHNPQLNRQLYANGSSFLLNVY